ncbi:MAG: sigma-70 family RNA polymerase sigma factor [Acidobacteriia bacterium]|nr:sigma-70 family RNA polymerase sigma factor [Terriglobia bacterium]
MASLALGSQPAQLIPPPEFQDLYQRYSESVYRTAFRVTGNGADAEDILQTVFLRVLDHRLTIDPIRNPEAYLRRAATNASIDLLRWRSSRAETAVDDALDYGGKESTALMREGVRRALARLPQQEAEMFVLAYLEGFSYDELAEQFGVARGTVASRLNRIKADLQKRLKEWK